MTDPDTPRSPHGWRYFRIREVTHARIWAGQGGIAVHENLFKSRGRRTAHLLARDEDALIEAALAVGCSPWWIQRTRTVHFDLVEQYLARALGRCAREQESRGRASDELLAMGVHPFPQTRGDRAEAGAGDAGQAEHDSRQWTGHHSLLDHREPGPLDHWE